MLWTGSKRPTIRHENDWPADVQPVAAIRRAIEPNHCRSVRSITIGILATQLSRTPNERQRFELFWRVFQRTHRASGGKLLVISTATRKDYFK